MWAHITQEAVKRVGRTATVRATARTARTASRRSRARPTLERCQHGLLRGTCAICLQMEETIDDLHPGRLAPEERPGRMRGGDEAEEAEEE